MTPQEIFDTVATHLFTQGERATDNYTCVYRTPEGLKCAVGCLIPNKLYRVSMEGTVLDGLLRDTTCQLPKYFRENRELLRKLQTAHDNQDNWSSSRHMRKRLEEIAKEHYLNYDILKTLSFSWDIAQ